MGFNRTPYPDCNGTGELRIHNENINAHFEVERQALITDCPRCRGLFFYCRKGLVRLDQKLT